VDLDNAVVAGGMGTDASAQQFAVVVVNPSPSSATVGVWVSDAAPGSAAAERLVDEAVVDTNGSHVFDLERREVDGSSADGANDGSHTAWTANAYRIRSTAPVVVYQFNPLQSVDTFSTDASLLIPTSSLGSVYTALGWPQTVANTPDPDTDLGTDLRAFLAIVGSEPGTRVRVTLAADIVPLPEPPPGAEAARAGETLEIVPGPTRCSTSRPAGSTAT